MREGCYNMKWPERFASLRVWVGILIVLGIAAANACAQSDPNGSRDPCLATVTPDFNNDGTVNFLDCSLLAQSWDPNAPASESPLDVSSDGVIGWADLAVLTNHWLETNAPVVHIQWQGHAGVRIWTAEHVVYIDPRNLAAAPHDATVVLVTHPHDDHYSAGDIAGVSDANTILLAPADVIADYGAGQVMEPNETVALPGLSITAVPAYTIHSRRHPKDRKWLGFVVQFGTQRIYCAGDTDLTEAVKALRDIDVAILPVSGTFAMDAEAAAEATTCLQPRLAIPYHWGKFKGKLSDAEAFADLAACDVLIMSPGEIFSSDDWPDEVSPAAP
jgi:L-ascorbate metabolism protein UlaG (beta-lactamase superfamily)